MAKSNPAPLGRAYDRHVVKSVRNARRRRYKTPRWRALRARLLEAAGYRCQKCGKAGRLEVDHKKPWRDNPDIDFYDPDNLQVLCVSCHAQKTRAENPRLQRDNTWVEFVNELM